MKGLNFEFKDSQLIASLDSDQDGAKSVEAKLALTEAVQEAFQKGEAIEGAKVAAVKFSGTKLIVELDTDKDGEKLFTLEVDLVEAVDESGLLKLG